MLLWEPSLIYQGCYMQELRTLIDKASKVCGSDSALARRMGIHQPTIAEMRSGKRSISPVTAAELADIAGEDAREAAIAAVIESTKGTRREGAMREILGKALAAGVAGMLVISYSGDLNCCTEKTTKTAIKVNSLYIVSLVLMLLRGTGLGKWTPEFLSRNPRQNAPGSLREPLPLGCKPG